MAEWPENRLYKQWRQSDPADRVDVEAKLFAAVKRHAQAVLWEKLGEAPDELVDKTAEAAITQLAKFKQKSKFSTWVQGIAQRKAKQYIRGKVRERKVFDEYTVVVESDSEDALDRRDGEITPSVTSQVESEIALSQFRQSLPSEDATLLELKERGLESTEIAEAMGTTVEAVDSRWARLKRRVKKTRAKPKIKNLRSRRRK